MSAPTWLAVCWKWVDHRPDIDPLTGAVQSGDARFGGVSEADAAALELALRTAEAWGARVRVVSAGGPDADRALRDALAAGAHDVVRVDLDTRAASAVTAAALADAVADAALVWCGDYSPDRGSGSVPVFLAAHLGAAGAFGAVAVDVLDDRLHIVRRLDGGRREVLDVTAPAVISVEGAVASLRRAPLAATLRAERHEVRVIDGPTLPDVPHRPLRPFRPRPRGVPAPRGATALDRVRELTGTTATSSNRTEVVHLEPQAAAERILEALRQWGARGDQH